MKIHIRDRHKVLFSIFFLASYFYWKKSFLTPKAQRCLFLSSVTAHAQLLGCVQLFATCSLPGSSVHGIFLSKNAGVGCHFILQRIFPTQGWNPSLQCLLYQQMDSLPPGKPSDIVVKSKNKDILSYFIFFGIL